MSFLVSETKFAFSDDIYRSVNVADTSVVAATAVPAARPIAASQPLMGDGAKTRICVAFYETAQCPNNNCCEYAHHFLELNSFTQNKLLETVPVESIPQHFILPPATCGGGVAERPAGKTNSHCRPRRGAHPPDSSGGGNANPCDNSLSSLASSADSFVGFGSRHVSKDVSPHKSARREDNVETFRIRLPQRCRYPHRATRGTYYDVLGVQRSATQEDIIASYRRWQKEYKRVRQVDQQNADARDTLVVEARNVLGHPVLRREYDHTLPSLWSVSGDSGRDFPRGAAAVSSANSSCSNNVDRISITTNNNTQNNTHTQMRLALSLSTGDVISLAPTGPADESIW